MDKSPGTNSTDEVPWDSSYYYKLCPKWIDPILQMDTRKEEEETVSDTVSTVQFITVEVFTEGEIIGSCFASIQSSISP